MKSYWYWKSRGLEHLERMEDHSKLYHDSIFDIPSYCVLFFYVFMALIAPKSKYPTKY